MSIGSASKQGGLNPLTVNISGPAGEMERLLGPGTHVFGGGLMADIVLPTHDSSEIFSITRAMADSSFSLKILAEGVLLDGALMQVGQKVADLMSALVSSQGHDFDIRIATPPKISLKDRIGTSTAGLRGSFDKIQPKGKLNDIAQQGQGVVLDVWKRNPKAVAALLLAGFLVIVASSVPMTLSSAMMSSPRTLPVLPHLRAITSQTLLVEEMRRRAQAAELIPQVTINASPDGQTIVLTGAVSSNENTRLTEIITNLRGRSTPPLAIENSVSFAPPEDKHGIAGIVITPLKAVVIDTGDLVSVGETLPTGWRVVAIDEVFVELMRDGLSQKIAIAGQELRRTLAPVPPKLERGRL